MNHSLISRISPAGTVAPLSLMNRVRASRHNSECWRVERFRKSALELGPEIRAKLKKQIGLLASNPRHPSLGVKKIKGTASIFEARLDRDYRFTFEYGEGREIILRVVGPHDPTLKKP